MSWVEVVLGGLGGAVVAGGIGTLTAARLDRANAARAAARDHADQHAAGRLISSELLVAYERVERALSEKRWSLWGAPLERDGWKRHAHVLASLLGADVFDRLVRTYDELGAWQNRIALYLAQFPANTWMNLGGDLPEERESASQLESLRRRLEDGHRE